MKIILHAFGSLGDVQPYVAQGKGLEQSGHTVPLNTHSIFEALVRENGLGFFPITGRLLPVSRDNGMRG